MLLILYRYAAHVQFCTLNYSRENNVVVVALPSHTCHELQPQAISVSNVYKSFLQAATQRKRVMNAFNFGRIIHDMYVHSFLVPNIQNGSIKSGIWNFHTLKPNFTAVKHSSEQQRHSGGTFVPIKQILSLFFPKCLSILCNAIIEE